MKIQAGTRAITVDLNIAPLMRPVAHGGHDKDMVVLHETVSRDYPGFADILSVATYMPTQGYGIHGVIDGEGYLAWAVDMRHAVLYHADSNDGGVNSRAVGIELVSRVMIDYPDNTRRFAWWWDRDRQIEKCAQLLAFISRADGVPLEYSDGTVPGVTTHWQVTKTFAVDGGHTDCWPRHAGGYFPVNRIIWRARQLKAKGY